MGWTRSLSWHTAFAAVLAVALVLAAAGCGDSDEGGEIPPETAAGLLGALADLEGAVRADSCIDARDSIELFNARLGSTSTQGVDEGVREQLATGAERLEALVLEDVCVSTGTTDAETTPPPVTTPPTTPPPAPEETEPEEGENGEDGEGEDSKPPKPPKEDGGPNAPPGPAGNPGQPPDGDTGTGDTGTGDTDTDGTGGTGTGEGEGED